MSIVSVAAIYRIIIEKKNNWTECELKWC